MCLLDYQTSNKLSIIQKKYLKEIFTFAINTGMRLGELTNMKWSWIDFADSTIHVINSKSFNTKSKVDRIIPMNNTTFNILQLRSRKKIKKKSEYVFINSKGIKFNGDFVSKQFKKAVRAAELNHKIHFHTLRHSCFIVRCKRITRTRRFVYNTNIFSSSNTKSL